LIFDWGRKKEGREGKKEKKNPTTGSLSPLSYLYLTLILELCCLFRQFLRGKDSSSLPPDRTPVGGRELSSSNK